MMKSNLFDKNNLQVLSNVNPYDLERAVNKIKPDNNLKGLSNYFCTYEKNYNVNAIIMMSIACLESAYGTSKLAKDKNNLFGLDAKDSLYGTSNYGSGYNTKEDSIKHAYHRVGKQYITLDTKCTWRYVKAKDIYSVGNKWCSKSDWADKVVSIANRIIENLKGDEGMKIGVIVGHSILKNGNCTSAGGYVQEYAYCKELAPFVVDYFRKEGHRVELIICPERRFTSARQERTYKLNLINGKGFDLIIELHLNAFNGSAKGTEVLYYPTSNDSKVYAQRVNDKLDDIFTDRHIKARKDLYILRETDCNAILIECFFCDNKEDYLKADEIHEKRLIAKKIVEGVINKMINDTPNEEKIIYNIETGGFGSKPNAQKQLDYLQGLTGWHSYLKQVGEYDYCIVAGGFTGKSKVDRKMNALKELTGWWCTYKPQ